MRKSYILIGNLPVTEDNGYHNNDIKYIINFRVIYEYGILRIQFNKQVDAYLFSTDSISDNVVELDIANLIRLISFLETEEYHEQYMHFSSTKTKSLIKHLKGVYVLKQSIIRFLIDDKKQEVFDMNNFTKKILVDILKNSLDILKQGYLKHDLVKIKKEVQPASYNNSQNKTINIPINVTADIIPQAPKLN